MKITYDAEVDAVYIRFHEATVTTRELGEGIAVDFDAEGKLTGIEVLDAKTRLAASDRFREINLKDAGLVNPA
jgi:uncharacterized protein YuzE